MRPRKVSLPFVSAAIASAHFTLKASAHLLLWVPSVSPLREALGTGVAAFGVRTVVVLHQLLSEQLKDSTPKVSCLPDSGDRGQRPI